MKHTQGKWISDKTHFCKENQNGKAGAIIGTCNIMGFRDGEAEANAKFIAEATKTKAELKKVKDRMDKLVEAFEDMIEYMECYLPEEWFKEDWFKDGKRAIKKATK